MGRFVRSGTKAVAAGLVGAIAVVALPQPASAARAGGGRPQAHDQGGCADQKPKPGEYFLYYPSRECREASRDVSGRPCGNNRYTLFYGDRDEICRATAKNVRATAKSVNAHPQARFAVNLSPREVVPRPGAAGATGVIVLTLDPALGSVCFTLGHSGITAPTGTQVRRAAKGKNGPVVVDLLAARYDRNCVRAGHKLLAEVVKRPADYYVSVRTAEHPKGALRGQLPKPGGANQA